MSAEKINEIRARWARKRWQTVNEYDGSDWLVADCSEGMDCKRWMVTTDGVHGSDAGSAEDDATDIASAPDDVRFLLSIIDKSSL